LLNHAGTGGGRGNHRTGRATAVDETGSSDRATGGEIVSWEQIQGHWSHFKGRIKEQWGLFTTDFDLVLDGRRDQTFAARLHRYVQARKNAEERFRDVCTRS
jgi:uncharacterized protein YjbJ (UPF0337 family)